MYESAASDLRVVFTRKPELMAVHYPIGDFIPAERQNYLIKDSAVAIDKFGAGEYGVIFVVLSVLQHGARGGCAGGAGALGESGVAGFVGGRGGSGVGEVMNLEWSGEFQNTFQFADWYHGGNMVLSFSISAEAEARLKAKAFAAGVDVATYAARHLELMAAPAKSLREISGPIGEAFSRSGVSEDELSELLEAEKHAMRGERGKRAG